METVDVIISVPKAEKDLADGIAKIAKDIKDKNWAGLVSDSITAVAKLSTEFVELTSEMKSPLSAKGEIYLQLELEKVFFPQTA